MNRKGFVFLDILTSIVLIGLAAIIFIPILSNTHKTMSTIKIYDEMNYLGEYIFERLNSKDEYSKKLLSKLEDEIDFLDLEDKYMERYSCRIKNLEDEDYLWNIKIIVESINNEGEIPYVEFFGTIPK